MSAIIELKAENVKRLDAVHLHPGPTGMYVIGGNNGHGKSSVLDAILYALGGKTTFADQPVKTGREKAEISVTINTEPPLVVTRRIKPDGKASLTIKQQNEGYETTVSSPQKLLNALVGAVAFDPLSFAQLSGKKQLDVLRQLVGVDTADMDDQEAEWMESRREVNKLIAAMKVEVDQHPHFPDAVRVDVSELLEELNRIREHNEAVREREQNAVNAERDRHEARINENEAVERVAALRKELEEAEEHAAAMADRVKELAQIAEDLRSAAAKEDFHDDREIQQQIVAAEEANEECRVNSEREEKQQALADMQAEAKEHDEQITKIRKQRQEALGAAQWPVEGLGFGDNGITYQGLPFEQCSSAEQLTISTAIGLSQNPKLRIMLIRDGSLMDDDSLKTIADLAAKHEAQIWVERVGKGEECSVIIEDGNIAPDVEDSTAELVESV